MEDVNFDGNFDKIDLEGAENVKPEIYTFVNQTEEEVLKMFGNIKIKKENKETRKPCLSFSDSPDCFEQIHLNRVSDFKKSTNPETLALWRKLSGVQPEENVEAAAKLPDIMDHVLVLCKRKVSGIIVSWSDDHWNRCLLINGSRTKIRSNDLIAAWEGICHITDADDATKIISNVIVNKLERLFI